MWKTLAEKERLCEELEAAVLADAAANPGAEAAREQWSALPELPSAWEKKMAARRDAALDALASASDGRRIPSVASSAAPKRDARACSSSRWRSASRAPPTSSRSGSPCR